jgi:hypothetical protein
MTRRSLLTIAAVLAAALVLTAVALAASQNVTQTAHSGQVKATFSYAVTSSKSGFQTYSNEHLTIVRAGTTAYHAAVTDPNCKPCAPGVFGQGKRSVQVTDINHSGEPNVILTLYSGGAHCCTIAQLFTYAPASMAYVEIEHNFADPAFKLEQLGPGGVYRFISADARFGYVFTDFAHSGLPIQIWGFVNGAFADVTRSYPSLIAADAAKWLKAFNGLKTNAGGVLAAWAADEELLGNNALVQSTLQSALKAGHLNGNLVANGQKYVTLLNKFLIKLGYEK